MTSPGWGCGHTLQIYHILDMATLADVRRIAMALPGVVDGAALIERPDFGFSVPVKGKLKAFLWSWKEFTYIPVYPKLFC